MHCELCELLTSRRVERDHRIRSELFANVMGVHVYCRSNLHVKYMYTVWNRTIIILLSKLRIETILRIVSKFQVDGACIDGREARTNLGGK